MKGIFLASGVGTFVRLTAQLLEYVVESSRRRRAALHDSAFVADVPPRDAPPPNEIAAWYDEAA